VVVVRNVVEVQIGDLTQVVPGVQILAAVRAPAGGAGCEPVHERLAPLRIP
jgi:hypothetical protein